MSKPKINSQVDAREKTFSVRFLIALLLMVLGIAWIAVYLNVAKDAAEFVSFPGAKKPSNPLPWMADLARWNFAIGFGLAVVGLLMTMNWR